MDCSEATILIAGYAVGALAEDERSTLESHLRAGCVDCQAELDAHSVAATILAENLTPIAPNPSIKTQLLDRIATEPQISAPNIDQVQLPKHNADQSKARRMSYIPYVAATVAAIAAGSLIGNFTRFSDSDFQDDIAQRPPTITKQWQESLDAAEQAFGPPLAQLVSFDGGVDNSQFQTFVFHDRLAGQLHLLASKLPESATGEDLWLWILDTQGNVLAGSALKSIGNRRGVAITDSQDLPTNLSEVMVTAEASSDIAKPTGPVIVRAAMKQTP